MRTIVFAGMLAGLAPVLSAQVDPELTVNNDVLVVSTNRHPVTNNPYPYSQVEPPGYFAAPGVPAGARAWTHTPKLRAQGGGSGSNYFTVTGVSQVIHTGAAVQTWPAPNHYLFTQGIGPASPVAGSVYAYSHATTGADQVMVTSQPINLTQWGLYLVTQALTTPITIGSTTELLQYVEYNGGEYRDDANGGQTIAHDWQSGTSPDAYRFYCGWTLGSNPRALIRHKDPLFRPWIGLSVQEPVLTATGPHADLYANNAGETSRGLGACAADWSTAAAGALFFDVRAGTTYANGTCTVFLNVGSWFPASVPVPPFGNLLLNPGDPAFSALTGLSLLLKSDGEYDDGPVNQIPVPTLGPAAVGLILKAQGLVTQPGFGSPLLTSASATIIK